MSKTSLLRKFEFQNEVTQAPFRLARRNTHFKKYLVPELVRWYKLWAEDIPPLFIQVHFATPLTIRHQQSQIRITVQQLTDAPTGQDPQSIQII